MPEKSRKAEAKRDPRAVVIAVGEGVSCVSVKEEVLFSGKDVTAITDAGGERYLVMPDYSVKAVVKRN